MKTRERIINKLNLLLEGSDVNLDSQEVELICKLFVEEHTGKRVGNINVNLCESDSLVSLNIKSETKWEVSK